MISGILLAAGKSRRFGRDKLIQAFDHHHSIINQSVRIMVENIENVIVVIRPGDDLLRHELQQFTASIIECHDYSSGMSASIRCGIKACNTNSDGWIIALGDMPLVSSDTYQKILLALRDHELVTPFHQGTRGNPIGFGKSYLDVLLNLEGDKGARDLIKHPDTDIFRLDVNDPGILMDIDTPEDLEKAKACYFPS